MIDPLNIFQDIKKGILKNYPDVEVYAFGSRTRGISYTGKWDFDVLVVFKGEKLSATTLTEYVRPLFEDRIDENNNPVKIDIWTVSKKNADTLINIMNSANNGISLL